MSNGNIISVDTPDHHSMFMDLFRNELETMLNTLLLAELTELFAYDKYDISSYNTGNSRNIYYKRSLHTIFSNITIKILRNRFGQFQNKLLTPYNRNFSNLEEMIIQLYQKGITTREIADIIEIGVIYCLILHHLKISFNPLHIYHYWPQVSSQPH